MKKYIEYLTEDKGVVSNETFESERSKIHDKIVSFSKSIIDGFKKIDEINNRGLGETPKVEPTEKVDTKGNKLQLNKQYYYKSTIVKLLKIEDFEGDTSKVTVHRVNIETGANPGSDHSAVPSLMVPWTSEERAKRKKEADTKKTTVTKPAVTAGGIGA